MGKTAGARRLIYVCDWRCRCGVIYGIEIDDSSLGVMSSGRNRIKLVLVACALWAAIPCASYGWRQPEALEQFELAELRVWIVFYRKQVPLAYIVDRNGYSHVVIRGSVVGKDFGVVERITDHGLLIRELRCTAGEWTETSVWLRITKISEWNHIGVVVPPPTDRHRQSCP